MRISKDEWRIRLIGNDPTIDGYADYDGKTRELSRDVAFLLAEQGIDVIFDDGVWEREQRDILKRRAENVGVQAVKYDLDTSIETIRQRVAQRNRNPASDSVTFSGDQLEIFVRCWQPSGEVEAYLLPSEVG